MPTSSTASSPCHLEWHPHRAAACVAPCLLLLAAVSLFLIPMPVPVAGGFAPVAMVIAARLLCRRTPPAWTMQVVLPGRRYTRRFADGRVDRGEVLSASATWPFFCLRLRPGDSVGDVQVERYFPDTWQAPATRPWRLLVRAMRRPARLTASESPG